jgi:predicted metal-dependent HD superfamily phosphohydrolase
VQLSESLQDLGVAPAVTAAWLVQLGEHQRYYHTSEHIERMLSHLPASAASKEMIAAIWLHDIVYDPRAADNEERSAIQAMRDLAETEIDACCVAELIRGTKHHRDGSDLQNMLNDLDLGEFGASRSAYERYSGQIRMEYAFVPEDAYTAGRIQVLEHYDMMRIFKTERFSDREPHAHANLQWEIAKLRDGRAVAATG